MLHRFASFSRFINPTLRVNRSLSDKNDKDLSARPKTNPLLMSAASEFDQFNLIPRDIKKTLIEGYGANGFIINGVPLAGSCLLLPSLALQWKPNQPKEITKESILITTITNPSISLLLIGTGEHQMPVDRSILEFLSERGISVEVMSTPYACSTFNILNMEDRFVAAALLPL